MATKTIKVTDQYLIKIKDSIIAINKIEVKTNASNKSYTQIEDYDIFGDTIVLKRTYPEILVQYQYSEEGEAEQRVEKDIVNRTLNQNNSNANINSLIKNMNAAQEQLAANEASIFNEMDKVLSGFRSVAAPFMENAKAVAQNIPAIITSTAPVALQTSTEGSSIGSITGKTSTGGINALVVAAGSPKGLSSVYQGSDIAITGATSTQIKQVVKGVSAVNGAIDNISVLELVNEKTGKSLIESLTNLVNDANKNNKQITGEMSYANVLPAIVNKANGVSKISNFAESQAGVTTDFPNLIDPISRSFNTNINANTISENILLTSINQTTNIANLGGNIGTFGKDDHVYTIVDTIEELEKEISNISRPITAAMVHWSKTWANQFLTAYEIDEIHKAQQKFKLGVTAYTEALNKQTAGIMWHYVILKDGTLQRGRPIELGCINEMAWADRTIHIGFIAGYNVQYDTQQQTSTDATSKSITQQQWSTFDLLSKTLLKFKPGIGIVGHSDVHNVSSCPGFDVESYISDKFGYSSVYGNAEIESPNALTYEEMVNRLPAEIASTYKSEIVIDMESLSKENVNKDIVTGLPLPPSTAEITQAKNNWTSGEAKVQNKNIEFINVERDVILNNNWYDQKRTIANDALYNLRDDRKPTIEQSDEYRKILLNSGYVYTEEDKIWQKK